MEEDTTKPTSPYPPKFLLLDEYKNKKNQNQNQNIDFTETSYFKSNKTLPTPAAIKAKAKALSEHPDKTITFHRPRPVIFADLNLLVKFGKCVSVSEAVCLRAVKRTFGDGLIPVPVLEVFGWRSEGDDAVVFIYMELIRGDSLHDRWDSLSDEDRTSVCNQLRPMIDPLRQVEQDPINSFIGMYIYLYLSIWSIYLCFKHLEIIYLSPTHQAPSTTTISLTTSSNTNPPAAHSQPSNNSTTGFHH